MTSLVSAPNYKFLELRIANISVFDEPLFPVWRSSKDSRLSHKRLSNRSWRLMSERLFNSSQKVVDKSFWTFEDHSLVQELTPVRVDMSHKRPSLFSDQSRYISPNISTQHENLDANSSVASGDESSDISEDEYISGDYLNNGSAREHKLASSRLLHKPAAKKLQRRLSRALTHSKPEQNESHSERLSPTHIDEMVTDPGAGISKNKSNIFYISNSPSSQDYDKLESKGGSASSISQETPPANLCYADRKDSLFRNPAQLSASSPNNDDASSLSSTDISEVSDIEDNPTSIHDDAAEHAVADVRSAKSGKSLRSADDTESEWMSVSSESELASGSPDSQPITFAKRIPIPKAGNDDPNISPPAEDTLKNSPTSFQPRSLLSGLFLSEMTQPSVRSPVSTKSATVESSAPKPVLKRSSTTGVITVDSGKAPRGIQRPSILLSKRYASSTDFTRNVSSHRSPVLYIAEEELIKEEATKSQERNLYAKQTSSVGLSNFLATAEAKINSYQSGPKNGSRSSDQDASGASADNLLSSSLSKYTSLQRQGSLKRIFSKSSISLTSLLGPGITGKLRLNSDTNRSNENIKGNLSSSVTQPMASSFAEHLSQQNAMGPSKSDSTITSSKSVRVEPKVLKGFTPSVDISESLKDSLIIDHKLGKAPLPDRVISDKDLFSGYDKETFVHDSNDYHSTGW